MRDRCQWVLQCDLESWALSIDAANLDTTAIGETFSEHVKSLVRGAGTLNFLVDHRNQANELDSIALLRLVLYRKPVRHKREILLIQSHNEPTNQVMDSILSMRPLLTNTRVNISATDLITGTLIL